MRSSTGERQAGENLGTPTPLFASQLCTGIRRLRIGFQILEPRDRSLVTFKTEILTQNQRPFGLYEDESQGVVL